MMMMMCVMWCVVMVKLELSLSGCCVFVSGFGGGKLFVFNVLWCWGGGGKVVWGEGVKCVGKRLSDGGVMIVVKEKYLYFDEV